MTYITDAKDWVDTDVMMYLIGCSLGIFPPPTPAGAWQRSVKAILWSSNEIEETLTLVIKRLYHNGVLLFDDEQERYRWNPAFTLPDSGRIP